MVDRKLTTGELGVALTAHMKASEERDSRQEGLLHEIKNDIKMVTESVVKNTAFREAVEKKVEDNTQFRTVMQGYIKLGKALGVANILSLAALALAAYLK